MSIIAISGKMQSGKNTVASIIQYLTHEYETHGQISQSFDSFISLKYDNDAFSWKQKSFAGKLKEIVSILTGIPVEDLERQEVKDRVLGEEWWMAKEDGESMFPLLKYIPYSDIDKHKGRKFIPIKLTVRELLQKLGTDLLRDKLHPNVHINALFADYTVESGYSYPVKLANKSGRLNRVKNKVEVLDEPTPYSEYPNWIITDVRFPNELQAIKDRDGISIRVNRDLIKFGDKIITKAELQKEIDKGYSIHTLKTQEHPSETALDDATFDYVIDNNGTIEELVKEIKAILIAEGVL